MACGERRAAASTVLTFRAVCVSDSREAALFVYPISVCKYAYCTVGGLPIICVCGLCPVSAEGELEKETIVVE